MNWNRSQLLSWFKEGLFYKELANSSHALERECLRINSQGSISRKGHPLSLGSTLCNPFITTDFGEAQLELITPQFKSEEGVLKFLADLHTFIQKNIGDESIWASSTPCAYGSDKEIDLAVYGSTQSAYMKNLYRRGLAHRYGKIMQTLSGVHYNFSFSPSLVHLLRDSFGKEMPFSDFKTDLYFHICRNFLRYSWLNTYLFGATPICDASFLEKGHPALKLDNQTYVGENATSIRMSELGYYSKVQTQIAISYDTLGEYLSDMEKALTEPYPPFEKIGLFGPEGQRQISNAILQLPAEHYSRIRPKPKNGKNGFPLDAMRDGGIEYVEARAVDIDPFSPDGINLDQMRFLHTFLLFCLLEKSPPLSFEEEQILTRNQNLVALHGRKKGLEIETGDGKVLPLVEEGNLLLQKLEEAAELLDLNYEKGPYLSTLRKQKEKVEDPSKTPSGKILDQLKASGKSYREWMLDLSKKHRDKMLSRPLTSRAEQTFHLAAKRSLEEKTALEKKEDFLLPGYEHLELSTQMMMREARDQGIEFHLVDEKDHLLLLKKGAQEEYVKQATITSKDSLISYFLMENKHVTKNLLHENGLPVPLGDIFDSKERAEAAFQIFSHTKLVVKPSHTNYGIGIHFIEKGDATAFGLALDEGFSYGDRVIVEEFIPGLEYRFLVIGDKVAAVCKRIPANVVGNGVDPIRTLVRAKNKDPDMFKYPKYRIRLSKHEKAFLLGQGLYPSSVPEKGKRVFLRANSNVSTGGDPIDMTNQVHPEFKALALRAAKVVGANFCGLDIMIEDPSKPPQMTPHAIIEMNFNPAIYLHRYPTEGTVRKVEKDVLDLLFPA